MGDSRLYKQAGNSVPVPMIYQVARRIIQALDSGHDFMNPAFHALNNQI